MQQKPVYISKYLKCVHSFKLYQVLVIYKNHAHVKKVGHNSEFLFGIY